MPDTKLDDAMRDAVNQVISNPDTHGRFIRMSQALLAVSSIETPNPIEAVGHMLGSAVEFALQFGLSREFVTEFVGKICDTLSGPDGDKLRDAARRQQG